MAGERAFPEAGATTAQRDGSPHRAKPLIPPPPAARMNEREPHPRDEVRDPRGLPGPKKARTPRLLRPRQTRSLAVAPVVVTDLSAAAVVGLERRSFRELVRDLKSRMFVAVRGSSWMSRSCARCSLPRRRGKWTTRPRASRVTATRTRDLPRANCFNASGERASLEVEAAMVSGASEGSLGARARAPTEPILVAGTRRTRPRASESARTA